MEKWIKQKDNKILLNSEGEFSRILSIEKVDGDFLFKEECDGYFKKKYNKDETLKIIDELREWVKSR
jgi:hypothetical protein